MPSIISIDKVVCVVFSILPFPAKGVVALAGIEKTTTVCKSYLKVSYFVISNYTVINIVMAILIVSVS